jgi:hypothetical protein
VVKFALAQRRYGVSAVLAMIGMSKQISMFKKEVTKWNMDACHACFHAAARAQ